MHDFTLAASGGGGAARQRQRRKLLLASGALLLLAPFLAGAQPRGKPYLIGYIQTASPEEQAPLTKAFIDGLRDLGYVEGRNIVVERRFAWGKPERLPELAAELVRRNPNVIVTGANPVIAAVRQATATIPVVMTTSRDPVGSSFVASLARPGGNITGFSSDPTPEVQSKRLELLREAIPKASRLALLSNPATPVNETYKSTIASTARKLGMSLFVVDVRGRDEFADAFAAMARASVDALVVVPDPLFFTARALIVQLAATHRLPAVFHAREFVEVGGLMSYGSNLADQFRRSALYVDKILKGAKPADLPVEQASKLEFVVNLKTAKALGIAVPPTLRLRADEVIE